MADQKLLSPGWMIGLGLAMIVGGLVAVGLPHVMTLTMMTFLGVILCAIAAFQILAALQSGSWGAGIGGFLGGVLYLVAGILVINRPMGAAAIFTLVLGMVLLFRGAMHIGLSLDLKPEKGWGWVLTGGVLGILLGILLLVRWPMTSIWFIGLVVGIEILWSGFSMLTIGMALKAAPPAETA